VTEGTAAPSGGLLAQPAPSERTPTRARPKTTGQATKKKQPKKAGGDDYIPETEKVFGK
jgi:hypothetical protein